MRAGEVLDLLQISRLTLKRYREHGYLKATKLPTGHFDYDVEDVYRMKNGKGDRQTVAYARVSTNKQKNDLENQVNELKEYSSAKGFGLNKVFQDVASGISFENRKHFFELLDLVIQGKVKRVLITREDRLARVGFDMFKHLFDKFHTEIVVVSKVDDPKRDEEELFEEITTLLQGFSKISSAHKLKK